MNDPDTWIVTTNYPQRAFEARRQLTHVSVGLARRVGEAEELLDRDLAR